jgi:hypothetical protein
MEEQIVLTDTIIRIVDSVIQARVPVIDSTARSAVASAEQLRPEFAFGMMNDIGSMYNQVLMFTIALFALFGLIIPLLLHLGKSYTLKVERQEIQNDIEKSKADMHDMMNQEIDNFNNRVTQNLELNREESRKEWVKHEKTQNLQLEVVEKLTKILLRKIKPESESRDRENAYLSVVLLSFLDIVDSAEDRNDFKTGSVYSMAVRYASTAHFGLEAFKIIINTEWLEELRERKRQLSRILEKSFLPEPHRTSLQPLSELLNYTIETMPQ